MHIDTLREKAAALHKRITDPNCCSECYKPIHGQRRWWRFTIALANGTPYQLVWPVCEPCFVKGAPLCREMAELVSGSLDLETPTDIKFAEDLVLLMEHFDEFKSGLTDQAQRKQMN